MKFNERFDIYIGQDEAKKRFVNRAYNRVFYRFFTDLNENDRYHIKHEIASGLGDKYEYHKNLENYVGNDFYHILLALEIFYHSLESSRQYKCDELIKQLMSESEVDLGGNMDRW